MEEVKQWKDSRRYAMRGGRELCFTRISPEFHHSVKVCGVKGSDRDWRGSLQWKDVDV